MDPQNKTNARDTLQSEHSVEIHTKDKNQDEIPNGSIDIEGSGNASSPVHVPAEILSTIFRYILPPETEAQQGARTALASVCRYWNMVVNNSPILWSVICHIDPMESISTSLAKSREASLDVYGRWVRLPFHGTPETVAILDGRQRTFWALVVSHRRRWRSLELQFGLPPNHSSLLSPGATPRLERLSLSFSWKGQRCHEPLDLLEGPIPRLRHLFLDAVPLRWGSFSSPNLSILHLTRIGKLGPHLSQLYDILTTCPNLREITLGSITSLAAPGPLDRLRPVQLHRLRVLVLSYIPTGAAQRLLEDLRVPAECSVSLEGRVQGSPMDSLFPSHLPDLPTKCLAKASRIVIAAQGSSVRLYSDGLWSLNLTLDDMNVIREVLLWLDVTDTPPDTETIPIEVEWGSDWYPRDDFFHPVSEFGNVRRITIDATFGSFSPGPLGARNDGSPSFPGLRELRIKEATDLVVEALIVLVRERQATHQRNMSVETLRAIIFNDLRSEAQLPPITDPETFRELLYFSNKSNIEVWWYGALMAEEESSD